MQATTPPKKAVKDQLHTKVLLPYFEPHHWESNNLRKTQYRLYEKAIAHDKSTFNKVRMFLTHNVFGWIWSYITSRFWFIHRFQTYDGTDKGIYQLPNEAKITLLADWASFTEDSAEVAHQSAKQHPDLSIHLGDIYFVGHRDEIKENFDHKVWHYGKMGSLAIPGNHEMYANGYDYFDVLLPEYMSIMQNGVKQQQKASFFCVENDHWRIVALDTGYKSVSIPIWEMIFPPKADLNKKQRAWIENELKLQNPADKRGIVILSHHQCLSAFEKGVFPTQAQQLREIVKDAAKTVLWFWGHEHRMTIYDKQTIPNGLEAYCRCIGNAGQPVQGFELPAKNNEIAKAIKLQYYDGRKRETINKIDVGFNGFVTLKLKNEQLVVQYLDQKDTLLFEEVFGVDALGNVVLEKEVNHLLTGFKA